MSENIQLIKPEFLPHEKERLATIKRVIRVNAGTDDLNALLVSPRVSQEIFDRVVVAIQLEKEIAATEASLARAQ